MAASFAFHADCRRPIYLLIVTQGMSVLCISCKSRLLQACSCARARLRRAGVSPRTSLQRRCKGGSGAAPLRKLYLALVTGSPEVRPGN